MKGVQVGGVFDPSSQEVRPRTAFDERQDLGDIDVCVDVDRLDPASPAVHRRSADPHLPPPARAPDLKRAAGCGPDKASANHRARRRAGHTLDELSSI